MSTHKEDPAQDAVKIPDDFAGLPPLPEDGYIATDNIEVDIPVPPLEPPNKRDVPFKTATIAIFGIILPIIMVLEELTLGIVKTLFFDPFPTIFHVLLYALIPIACGLVLHVDQYMDPVRSSSHVCVLGIATGIAFLYTVIFLPLLPYSVLGIMIVGIGFIGLSPLLALLCCLYCSRYLHSLPAVPAQHRLPGFWMSLALGFVLLLGAELTGMVTKIGMRMAASPESRTSLRGVQLLRSMGNRNMMLRACYVRTDSDMDVTSILFSFSEPVTTEVARRIYYRVTGTPFNAMPAPKQTFRDRGLFSDFEFDPDQGSAAVGGVIKDLSLTTSRLDGSVNAEAAMGYLEWTLIFHNAGSLQREARAQIALPPGAVVSRATLWVNDEEREAAFAARGKAREAYQEVAVVQQRDPLLVTTCGPDRILLQCFPVPAGQYMKVRIGITAPLQLTDRTSGVLPMPHFLERNFAVNDEMQHAIWVESRRPLQAKGLHIEEAPGSPHTLRGKWADMLLASPDSAIHVTRDAALTHCWAPDTARGAGYVIRQQQITAKPQPLQRVVFVLDTSVGMQQAMKDMHTVLTTLPPKIECSIFTAGDTVQETTVDRFHAVTCVGGIDNAPALLKAWECAAERPRSAIIWLHGPQPLESPVCEELKQCLERRPESPRLYAVQLLPGSNRILEALDGIGAVEVLPRLGTVQTDLNRLYARWQGKHILFERKRVAVPDRRDRAAGTLTSAHLERLWANDQVKRLYHRRNPGDTEMAIAIARNYHLVTPVTGAVVLENREQFKRAGLEPVPAGSVPTIPEPEVWALLIVAALVLLATWWRRRRACAAAL